MLRKIVVVDDSEYIREGVSDLLRLEGYGVIVAADGPGALEIVDGGRYHALVTDYQMPGMNGLELIEALRAKGIVFDLTILISAHPKSELGEAWSRHEGSVTYVRKPFEADTLMQALGG